MTDCLFRQDGKTPAGWYRSSDLASALVAGVCAGALAGAMIANYVTSLAWEQEAVAHHRGTYVDKGHGFTKFEWYREHSLERGR